MQQPYQNSQGGRGQRYPQGQRGQGDQAQETWKPIEIKRIIEEDNPKLLISEAERLARQLGNRSESKEAREATRTQIRRLFSTFRQIEFSWPHSTKEDAQKEEAKKAYFELVLMRPKLKYQAKRQQSLQKLAETLDAGIQAVGDDRQKLARLMQFFEATVAYHTAI